MYQCINNDASSVKSGFESDVYRNTVIKSFSLVLSLLEFQPNWKDIPFFPENSFPSCLLINVCFSRIFFLKTSRTWRTQISQLWRKKKFVISRKRDPRRSRARRSTFRGIWPVSRRGSRPCFKGRKISFNFDVYCAVE